MSTPDLVAIRELAVALTTYNILHDPVPAGIDVPDDYERGINDAGWRLHALVNPDQTRVTPPGGTTDV